MMNKHVPEIFADARWISFYPEGLAPWHPHAPAAVFRKEFSAGEAVQSAKLVISGLGLYEAKINHVNVSNAVLQPTWAAFDKRFVYNTFDITALIQSGTNTIEVMLGNGMYNCSTRETWHFNTAPWRDYPKLLCALYINDAVVAVSDTSWQWAFGPIVFNSWHGGETYDARRESRLDDPAEWKAAVPSASPGGVACADFEPPCRVIKRIRLESDNGIIYHAPYNMSGWARIFVEGEAGAEVTLEFGESVLPDQSNVDNSGLARYVQDGTFQTDRYILKGGGVEVYEPRFTVHGFCVLSLKTSGRVKVLSVEACEVRQDFAAVSQVKSSAADLDELILMAQRTLLANSVHLPTDCPQREKNGWSADAALMAELSLYSFDCADFFEAYIQRLCDTQRLDGHIACIAPSAGWGYNWGSGPAWDMALYRIAYRTALHTGNPELLHEALPVMLKNLDYYRTIEDNGIIHNGLSDWYPPAGVTPADYDLVRTAFYINMYNDLGRIAGMLNERDSIQEYLAHGSELKKLFNARFAPEKLEHPTEIALSVLFDIAPEELHLPMAEKLASQVRQAQGKVIYGMHGAWATAMVLGKFGFADELMSIFLADEFPSFGYWRKKLGATTFWESFSEDFAILSRNHGAFAGGLRAFYEYIAGFRHDEKAPGRNFLQLQPVFPAALNELDASYCNYRIRWQRQNNEIELEISVPDNASARLILPDGAEKNLTPGFYQCNLPNKQ